MGIESQLPAPLAVNSNLCKIDCRVAQLTWVVHCMYNKPSYLDSEFLKAHHILPEGTSASGLSYRKSEKQAEVVCEDGLRIKSSPHRIMLSSPHVRNTHSGGGHLRPVLERYLAAAPEVVCNSIDIKPDIEVSGLKDISFPLLLQASVAQFDSLTHEQSHFQIMLNGSKLSFFAKKMTVAQELRRSPSEKDGRIVFSAEYNHMLKLNNVSCPRVANIVARSSKSDLDHLRLLIDKIFEKENVERLRSHTFEDFDDLDELAEEIGLECPSKETKARARQITHAIFEKHPNYYMIEPTIKAGIIIRTSAEDSHSFALYVFPDGKAICYLTRQGKMRRVNYASTEGLPDEFLHNAVTEHEKQDVVAS